MGVIRKVGVGAVLGDCVNDGRVSVEEVLGDQVRANSRITAAAPHRSSLINNLTNWECDSGC